jgi:hypothetical protein
MALRKTGEQRANDERLSFALIESISGKPAEVKT